MNHQLLGVLGFVTGLLFSKSLAAGQPWLAFALGMGFLLLAAYDEGYR